MFITMPLVMKDIIKLDGSELLGYTTMVVALSMVFFGIKSYRDNHKNGVITFWEGCKIGLLVTLIASVMYALAWELCYTFIADEFTQKMTEGYLAKLESGGATASEVEEAKKEWDTMWEMYKNPIIRFGFTLMEIVPVGILLTLISAGILRKKEFMPPA
jgi:hypothetical protein